MKGGLDYDKIKIHAETGYEKLKRIRREEAAAGAPTRKKVRPFVPGPPSDAQLIAAVGAAETVADRCMAEHRLEERQAELKRTLEIVGSRSPVEKLKAARRLKAVEVALATAQSK